MPIDVSRIGVCSWSLQPLDPRHLVSLVREVRLTRVQLALVPMMDQPGIWSRVIDALRGSAIDVVSGMLATRGEDYSTLDSIARTGGIRPDETWSQNLALAGGVARLARKHAIPLVTFHAGFLPEDAADPERAKLLDRLRRIADVFAQHKTTVALETGQESADTLLAVLDELDHDNVGVNFDPANMVLYGKGDPVDALRKLAPHVKQIHVKDATPSAAPGEWGDEAPVGKGAVDWSAFLEVAEQIDPPVNYIIEREAGSARVRDIAAAREMLIEAI